METLAKFIETNGLRMTIKPRSSNPNMDHDAWHDNASHWTCTIHFGRKRMAIPFSQGSAHKKPPELTDVLDCLASDAAGIENARDFTDWCSEYGYDADSRKAERIYRTCKRQAERLHSALGDNYETLLWETERL